MAEAQKKTFAQDRAEREAQRMLREVKAYQSILPLNESLQGGVRVCRADGWNLQSEFLDGEFDLDEPLARQLAMSAVAAGKAGNAQSPAAASGPVITQKQETSSWLQQYLFGDPAGEVRTAERAWSETKNTVAGPGNIVGNAVGVQQAVNAGLLNRTSDAVKAAARAIETGAASSVKINEYMTLYNANTQGRGPPWPRLRIRGMPVQVVMPALGEGAKVGARGIRGGMSVADSMIKAERMGKLAAGAHWSGAASFLHNWKGGLFLSVGPSAALDVYSSIEQDVAGNRTMNWRKFGVASAKSQSGNLLGWGAGALVGVGAVAIIGVGAPAVLIGLAVGGVVQVLWGTTGGSNWAESTAQRMLMP